MLGGTNKVIITLYKEKGHSITIERNFIETDL